MKAKLAGQAMLLGLFAVPGAVTAPPDSAVEYTPSGDLKFPTNYREWVFLSSGVGMTYGPARALVPEDHPAIDNVFVNPEAYRYFLAKGTWPDKTSLVLEVRRSETSGSINHGGFYQANPVAVEVHVKDKRFDGGWAFFAFEGAREVPGKLFPRSADCYSCHAQHGSVDTTFVQFYPTLRPIAEAKGTFKKD